LLNLEKPEYIPVPVVKPEIELSTKVTKEDLANAVVDEYGVKYSKDELRLLKAPGTIKLGKGCKLYVMTRLIIITRLAGVNHCVR